MQRLAVLLCALAAPACVSAQLERERVFAPPPAAVAALRPGEADLERCLALLGAPLWVREHRVHGLELAYGAADARRWRVGVSVQVARGVNPSFRYERGRRGLEGWVLVFDADWRLASVREGWLGELEARRERPATVEQLEGGA